MTDPGLPLAPGLDPADGGGFGVNGEAQDYRTLNRANWDERAVLHAASACYGLERYVDDPRRLSEVVAFDRERLGDVAGLQIIHLQCHLGTDTLSLARLGADVTGLDFSAAALERAAELACRAGAEIAYRRADVYDAVDVAGAGSYDLVYTGTGALCWLPDIRRRGRVVAGLLRPRVLPQEFGAYVRRHGGCLARPTRKGYRAYRDRGERSEAPPGRRTCVANS